MSPGASGRGFRTIDHTADVGIEAWAGNPAELFNAAAEGMFSIIFSPKEGSNPQTTNAAPRVETIEMSATDWGGLLYDWLSELLYFYEVQGLVLRTVSSVEVQNFSLKATVQFDPFDENRHERLDQIKAVTFHGLDVKEGPPWEVQVIFDV